MVSYSNKLKKDLLKETNNKCFYCGDDLNGMYEIEHFIPKSLFGSGTRKNLTVSCKKCNRIKSDYSIEKFKKRIKIEDFYYEKIKLIKGELVKRIKYE